MLQDCSSGSEEVQTTFESVSHGPLPNNLPLHPEGTG